MTKDAKEWLRRINDVLHSEWDPIGCGVPKDEYESFAGPIATLLLKGAPDSEIAAYLFHAETEIIGLDGVSSPDQFEGVIGALRALGVPGRA